MNEIYEWIGIMVILAFPAMLLLSLIAWCIEKTWKNFEILKGLFEYLIYRKHFHKWRKENKDMNPDGTFPAN